MVRSGKTNDETGCDHEDRLVTSKKHGDGRGAKEYCNEGLDLGGDLRRAGFNQDKPDGVANG